MTTGNTVQYFHGKHVVINGNTGFFEDGGNFELLRSDFIVTSLDGNTKLPKFKFSLRNGSQNVRRHGSKVMIFQLLMLRRNSTEQSTTSHAQVRTQSKVITINQEEFLFSSQGSVNFLDFSIAHQTKKFKGSNIDSFTAAQQNGLFIQGLAIVGNEDGRNVEDFGVVRTVL